MERFYTSDFAKSKFKSTPVPSNWALLGYEEPVYRGFKDNQAGEGFYVREFTIPQDWKDKLSCCISVVYGHRLKFGSTGTNWGVMIADILLLLLM